MEIISIIWDWWSLPWITEHLLTKYCEYTFSLRFDRLNPNDAGKRCKESLLPFVLKNGTCVSGKPFILRPSQWWSCTSLVTQWKFVTHDWTLAADACYTAVVDANSSKSHVVKTSEDISCNHHEMRRSSVRFFILGFNSLETHELNHKSFQTTFKRLHEITGALLPMHDWRLWRIDW